MGFYARHVLPRLIELAMRNPELTRIRAEVVPQAEGEILELGIGSGQNLPYYGPAARRVHGVDPSSELQALALLRLREWRAASTAPPVDFLLQSAEERLPLADQSIDTAVSTWSLCTIPDPVRALREVRRVLRPSGRLLFAEHGRAADPGVRRWQDRIDPLWTRLAGGCHLNRDIDALLRAAGFEIDTLDKNYLPGPRPFTYTYRGRARPS